MCYSADTHGKRHKISLFLLHKMQNKNVILHHDSAANKVMWGKYIVSSLPFCRKHMKNPACHGIHKAMPAANHLSSCLITPHTSRAVMCENSLIVAIGAGAAGAGCIVIVVKDGTRLMREREGMGMEW